MFAPSCVNRISWKAAIIGLSIVLSACGNSSSTESSTDESFSLSFRPVSGSMDVNCDNSYNGIGPGGAYTVGVTDLRFYISNIRFFDADDNEISLDFDDNDFQLNHEDGFVGLIDFTSNVSGYCALAAEGTARTNSNITGTMANATVSSISFDVGVPQAVMKSVIAATDDVTDTPSPLGEMYWSWASGYRHFVLNFTSMNAANTDMVENSGFHIGSTDCGSGTKALSDRDSCGNVNTASVNLDNFDLQNQAVTIDLEEIFANVADENFVSPVWTEIVNGDESACIDSRRSHGFCVTGEAFGLQCHSGAAQSACGTLFPNFGITMASGESDADTNLVFNAR